MAGLNIAHELLAVKVKGDCDMGEFKRKIDRMQMLLDTATP
jgi:cell division protein ZapA (FtsZ GTPase activity inhibitor)